MVDFDERLWAAVCQLYPDCYNARIGEIALGHRIEHDPNNDFNDHAW